MPFNIIPGEPIARRDLSILPDFDTDPATLGEQLGAAVELTTPLTGAAIAPRRERFEPEEGFDPADHLEAGEAPIASAFVGARSRSDMAAVRQRREREARLHQQLGEGPLNEMVAVLLSQLADPTTYLPLGTIRAGRALTSAVRVGATTAAIEAGTELELQRRQELRTIEESLAAIALGGVFGGALGGVAGALSGRPAAALSEIQGAASRDLAALARAESAGAAAVVRTAPEDTRLVGADVLEPIARGLDKIGLGAPSLRLMASPFAATREAALRLVDTGLVTDGVVRGVPNPTAVEVRIGRYDALQAQLANSLEAAYSDFRRAGGRLNRDDFYSEIGRAMRRADTHADPVVDRMAKEIRTKVFDPLKDAAIAARLLPEDVHVSTAPSYFSRLYRTDKLRTAAGRRAFVDRVAGWLEHTGQATDRADAEDIADDILDNILGAPEGRVPLGIKIGPRGALKDRTFNIPDAMIEEFLESNVLAVGQRLIRTLSADIEMQREFGALDASDLVRKIRDEGRAAADAATAPGEADRLLEISDRDQRLVMQLFDLVRGTHRGATDPRMAGMGSAVARSFRNLSAGRLLGSVIISQIPDFARLAMAEGFTRTFGKILADFGRGFKGIKLARGEAQLAGTALDVTLNQRAAALADIGERRLGQTFADRAERFTGKVARGVLRIGLMNRMVEVQKSIASMVTSTRILKGSEAMATGRRLSAADRRRMAQSGITDEMARRIADQAQHWQRVGSGPSEAILGGTDAWTDAQAVAAYRNTLLRDVDAAIITPGAGDSPIWTSSELGKTFFQLRRFSMAATHRILIASLQQRDASALGGMVAMLGLGALGVALSDIARGRDPSERDAGQWALDAFERSGLLAMAFEANGIMDMGGFGPLTLAAGKEPQRFARRGKVLERLGGPTAGVVEDAFEVSRRLLDGELTETDIDRFRRLAPGQNLFYARYLLDQMQKGTARTFGLEERPER